MAWVSMMKHTATTVHASLMQETAVSILCMDRQRFSMHSRTCHSCTISRPHFDIEPLLCGYKTRWSAFLRLVSCRISGYTKCGSDGLLRSYASFVTALRPHFSGQLLPRRFELESVDAPPYIGVERAFCLSTVVLAPGGQRTYVRTGQRSSF